MSTVEIVMNSSHPLLLLFLPFIVTSVTSLKCFLPNISLLCKLTFIISLRPLQWLPDYSLISDLLPLINGKAVWKS